MLGCPNYFQAAGSEIPQDENEGRILTTRTTFATALTAAAFVAGCGEDDKGSGGATTTGRAPAAGAPAREVAAVRSLLDRAADEYASGDAKRAERLVGDAYLEHFEEVEGPLGERDHELMESLEETIATTIRDRIRAGAPTQEVERLVERANRDLVRAEAALR